MKNYNHFISQINLFFALRTAVVMIILLEGDGMFEGIASNFVVSWIVSSVGLHRYRGRIAARSLHILRLRRRKAVHVAKFHK